MAHHLFVSFSHFFRVYGYWTVFLATLLEGAGVPLPGETLLLFAGFSARRGNIHLGWAIFAGVAGSTLGTCIGYFVGYLGGKAFLDGYRKRLYISPRLYARLQAIFLKNAGWTILTARFIAGLREIIGIAAGVFGMEFSIFFVYNFVGAVAWAAAIPAAGYWVGRNWRQLVHIFGHIEIAALAAFAAVVAVLILRHRRRGPAPPGRLHQQ